MKLIVQSGKPAMLLNKTNKEITILNNKMQS